MEFEANLRGAVGRRGAFQTIEGNAEHEYLVFQLTDDGPVLGCMKTVSKWNVTGARWLELWGSSLEREDP